MSWRRAYSAVRTTASGTPPPLLAPPPAVAPLSILSWLLSLLTLTVRLCRGAEANHGKRMSLPEAWPIIESVGANIRRLSLSIPADDSLIPTSAEQEALDGNAACPLVVLMLCCAVLCCAVRCGAVCALRVYLRPWSVFRAVFALCLCHCLCAG